MMKQKRIVAVALGLALSVSPMIMLPTAFADQVLGNPSSSISARSTAPNPLDKFSTAEKAFLNNHKDEIASALGIDRFDPSTTDYFGVKESALDTVAGKIPTANFGPRNPRSGSLEIDTTATGWLADGKTTQTKPAGTDLAYRITIRGKSGGTVAYTLHTVSKDASGKADPAELKNVTAIANGKPVQGFDPTKTGTWTVPDVVHVKIVNMPNDWKMTSCITELPQRKVEFTASKDGTTVTWTFKYDGTGTPDKPATGVDALKGVTATVDGRPFNGFDPTRDGAYRVAKGAEVKISNVPSDWTLDKTASDSRLVFTASKDGTTVTWTFEYQGKDDDGATINPDDNAGNNSQNNNDGTTSKPPANGVSPLASTGVGIGWVGWLIGILAIIGGALGITVAVRKPKGKATDETPEADDSEASSDQPRNA